MNDTDYNELISEIRALIEKVHHPIANYANVSAAIFSAMKDINWAGFYFLEDDLLVLGPFQGKPACVFIPYGQGVCGTAVKERRTLIVPDVHQFRGHITCDAASRSEIVIPMIKDDKIIGVLDIDSSILDRFNDEDRVNLEEIVSVLIQNIS